MEELLNHHMFATHAIVATGSVALGVAITHPLDSLKTLIQVGAGSKQQLHLSQVLDRVRSISGNLGFYSGFGWSVLGKTLGLGARFGTYELVSAFYKDGREENYVYVSEALLGGITAGATEAIISTPFEFLKLRSQVSAASDTHLHSFILRQESTSTIRKLLRGYSPSIKAWNNTIGLLSELPNRPPNMVSALKEYPWMLTGTGRPPFVCDLQGPSSIVSLEGWRAFWRGLRPGIFRDAIFGGVFFTCWQFLHIAMLDWKAVDMNPPPRTVEEIGPISPLASSLAAGFSGFIAAAASHSFDTAKSRSECLVVPKYIAMERKLLKWKRQGLWHFRVSGISPADSKFLFRGIWLRMARCGIGSFAIVGSYFLAVEHLLKN